MSHATSRWRITCFVTHETFRRTGVAGVALTAAVTAIEARGGGWVEATPTVGSHYDGRYHQLVGRYGRDCPEVEEFLRAWPVVDVREVGPVPKVRGELRRGFPCRHGCDVRAGRVRGDPDRAEDPRPGPPEI